MSAILYKLEDLLSNGPPVRVSVHVLLEANRVSQLESGVKNLVTLIQDISNMGMNPLLKAGPLDRAFQCNVGIHVMLVMMVSLSVSDALCSWVVG